MSKIFSDKLHHHNGLACNYQSCLDFETKAGCINHMQDESHTGYCEVMKEFLRVPQVNIDCEIKNIKATPPALTTFYLIRQKDVSGVSGTGTVLEGVVFTDGSVVVRWISDKTSWTTYSSNDESDGWENFLNIHVLSHPGNNSIIKLNYSNGTIKLW